MLYCSSKAQSNKYPDYLHCMLKSRLDLMHNVSELTVELTCNFFSISGAYSFFVKLVKCVNGFCEINRDFCNHVSVMNA